MARDKANDRSFAIKTIEKAKIMEDINLLGLLCSEIETLRMVDHPNIVKLYEVYENEVCIYLVLEYLQGGELGAKIKATGVFAEREAAKIMKCVLEALAYCHAKKILHRDLKPENLMLA